MAFNELDFEEKEKIFTVSSLSNLIKLTLESKISSVSLQGEISNFVLHSSGHRYFTLKDENAQISCVMWKTKSIRFPVQNGSKVIVRGSISVYAPQGKYQFVCDSMQAQGLGDIFAAIEQLKLKLRAMGFFDESIKKRIPLLPKRIGVSTSPTGAAIKDILSTLDRRYPLAEVIFRPTLVQGDGAAEDIVKAIVELNQHKCDVLIIGRGGGSIEDLFAYNSEIVATAIFESNTPIISAVGHETDVTIADFVADQRAATPTAAAELSTPYTINDLLNYFSEIQIKLNRLTSLIINNLKNTNEVYKNRISLKRLLDKIQYLAQKVDELENRRNLAIKNKLTSNVQLIDSKLKLINSLNPYSPLDRGFALLEYNDDIIKNTDSLTTYDEITIVRKAEKIKAKIL